MNLPMSASLFLATFNVASMQCPKKLTHILLVVSHDISVMIHKKVTVL